MKTLILTIVLLNVKFVSAQLELEHSLELSECSTMHPSFESPLILMTGTIGEGTKIQLKAKANCGGIHDVVVSEFNGLIEINFKAGGKTKSINDTLIESENKTDTLMESSWSIDLSDCECYYIFDFYIENYTHDKITGIKLNGVNCSKINQDDIEKVISAFIKEYSIFPETYKSIEFKQYKSHYFQGFMFLDELNDSDIFPYIETFEVLHTYKGKNKDGRMRKYSHYFVINYDLSIIIIEKERTDSVWQADRSLNFWLNILGRVLLERDMNELHLD